MLASVTEGVKFSLYKSSALLRFLVLSPVLLPFVNRLISLIITSKQIQFINRKHTDF